MSMSAGDVHFNANGIVGVPYQGFDKSQAPQVTGDPEYSSLGMAIEVRKGTVPS